MNFNQIVMSKEFESLDKSLIVEIIRRKLEPPVRLLDPQPEPLASELTVCTDILFMRPTCDNWSAIKITDQSS